MTSENQQSERDETLKRHSTLHILSPQIFFSLLQNPPTAGSKNACACRSYVGGDCHQCEVKSWKRPRAQTRSARQGNHHKLQKVFRGDTELKINTKEPSKLCSFLVSKCHPRRGLQACQVHTHPAGRAPISHCRAQLVSEIRARVPGALINIIVKSLHLASCWHCSKYNSIPHYPSGLPVPRGC